MDKNSHSRPISWKHSWAGGPDWRGKLPDQRDRGGSPGLYSMVRLRLGGCSAAGKRWAPNGVCIPEALCSEYVRTGCTPIRECGYEFNGVSSSGPAAYDTEMEFLHGPSQVSVCFVHRPLERSAILVIWATTDSSAVQAALNLANHAITHGGVLTEGDRFVPGLFDPVAMRLSGRIARILAIGGVIAALLSAVLWLTQ